MQLWISLKSFARRTTGSFAGAMAWNLGGFILLRLAVIGSGMAIAQTLGAEQFGIFAFFQLTVNNFAAYAVFGLATPLLQYVAKSTVDRTERTKVVAALQAILLASIVAVAALLILPDRIVTGNIGPSRAVIIVGVLGIVAQAAAMAIATGLQRFRDMAVSMALSALVVAIGTIFALVQRDVDWVIGWFACSNLVGALFLMLRCAGPAGIGWRALFVVDGGAIRAIMPMVGAMALVGALNAAVPWLVGRTLLASEFGLTGVAVFSAALNIFGLIMLVPSRMSLVAFPKQVVDSASNDHGAAKRFDRDYAVIIIGGTVATIALFLPFSHLVIGGFGPEVAAFHWVIVAMQLAAVLAGVSTVLGNRIVGNERPLFWLGANVLWVTATIWLLRATLDQVNLFAISIAYGGGYLFMIISAAIAYKFSWRPNNANQISVNSGNDIEEMSENA